MKCFGRFLPRKTARPAGQKQHISIGQGVLAIAPGDFLDDDCLTTAIDATRGIKQKNQRLAVVRAAAANVHPWYAVRVRSRFEFVTSAVLEQRGCETFLPIAADAPGRTA